MEKDFNDILKEYFSYSPDRGMSKVKDLSQAIRESVQPGMTLHINYLHGYPNAAVSEIARQFWHRSPNFTLVSPSLRYHGIILLHGGLIKRAIITYFGDGYPTPGPNPIAQKALIEGTFECQHWSLLSLTQRLMAGALGLKVMPTKSIIGSSMEEDNQDSFTTIDNPFEKGNRIGLLHALNPDLSILHGLIADPYGNTLITPPYGEGLWGAMASRKGVLVTVEKIVSPDLIRRYSHYLILPGYFVEAVSEVPFGRHSYGHTNPGIEGVEGYAEDYDFNQEYRDSVKTPERFDLWVKEWVLGCKNHEDYLHKLGAQRLLYLKGKAREDAWKYELTPCIPDISISDKYNQVEVMIIVASRKIKELVQRNEYRTILAGVGGSNLAAWLALYDLRREGYDIDLVAEVGFYGYAPRPGDPFIFNLANVPTAKDMAGIIEALGIYTSGENNRCLGAVGAGQVDKYGNINSTKIPGKTYLVGSGGVNDILAGAQETILVVEQSATRFLEKVPYITACGTKAKTLVSTLGVFEKVNNGKEFILTGYFPNPRYPEKEAAIREVKDRCGWRLEVSPAVKPIAPPTIKELKALRLFDPKRHFIGPFQE